MKRIKNAIFRLLIERIFKEEIYNIYEEGASDGYEKGCHSGWYQAQEAVNTCIEEFTRCFRNKLSTRTKRFLQFVEKETGLEFKPLI